MQQAFSNGGVLLVRSLIRNDFGDDATSFKGNGWRLSVASSRTHCATRGYGPTRMA